MHGYVSISQPWHPPSLSGSSQFLPAYLPEEPIGPGHMCTAGGSLEPQVEHFMALFVVRGEHCDMLVFPASKRRGRILTVLWPRASAMDVIVSITHITE